MENVREGEGEGWETQTYASVHTRADETVLRSKKAQEKDNLFAGASWYKRNFLIGWKEVLKEPGKMLEN